MTDVLVGSYPIYVGLPTQNHTVHDSINVDQGAVRIDADAEHVIRVKHETGDSVDIFAAIDKETSVKTMHVDSNGVVFVPNVVYGPADTSLNTFTSDAVTMMTENETAISEASAADDGVTNNLVQRSQSAGTEIKNLHVVADETNYTEAFPPAGLYFTQGMCRGSLQLVEDASVQFTPYTPGGSAIATKTFAFGRAVPTSGQTIANADTKRDGLLIEDETVNHSTEIMCSNELPTLRLVGAKATITEGGFTKPICPVIDVQNGSNETTFAVYDDGFVVQKGHQDTDPEALMSGHFSSGVFGPESVYIGSSRFSYDMTAHKLLVAKLKSAIPVYLVGKGIVAGQINEAYCYHGTRLGRPRPDVAQQRAAHRPRRVPQRERRLGRARD